MINLKRVKRGKGAASDNLAKRVLAGDDAPSAICSIFSHFFNVGFVQKACSSPPFPSFPGLPSLDAAFQTGVCQGVCKFGLKQIEFWILMDSGWPGVDGPSYVFTWGQ